MSPIAVPSKTSRYIELNRTFRELPKDSNINDDIDFNQSFLGGEQIDWPALINEYRVIILSEAGSGKTAEIHNIADTLRDQGKPAFFLRLEHIPDDFEDAFEVGNYEGFSEWLASGVEGWLLLDSVDEARLRHPRDFEKAIRKLSKQIGSAKDRAHIIITGRTTAWRPKSDLDYCTVQLPFAAVTTSESDSHIGDDSPEESLPTKTEASDKNKSIFKIVALNDFTSAQVALFAEAQGIADSTTFLDAVERADAWSFTARPQDLEELAEFWVDKGRIGSRLEIMRNSINRRLAERDQGRAETNPLSGERARQGARLLAATTTLTHNPIIKVPDGSEHSKGISVQTVLPEWNEKDQSVLLSRPIFDEAIYSAVRFHHRSVREYLCAEWFAELFKRETSRRTIEALFFRNQYGLDIAVPALRPILPWLAILDEKISERVRKIAPEIIFEGGDPTQLPLTIRRYILHEVCEQIVSGTTGRSMHDYAAAQRFANPDLTDDIRKLIQKHIDDEDLAPFLLRMVWLGQLSGALSEALKVALNPTAHRYTRITAFRAIKAVGSEEDQERIRQSFLTEAPELKRACLAELIEGAPSTTRTLTWLLACLEKSELKEKYSYDGLADHITEFVCATDVELLPRLVSGLNSMLSHPPMIEHQHCEISEKFQWLLAPAAKTVERLILTRHSASLDQDSLTILHKLSTARGYGVDDLTEVKTEFSNLVPEWTELNRALFWFEVDQSRKVVESKRGERLTNFWQASSFGPFWRFTEDDFEYVAEEICRQVLQDDKLVALSLAFNLYVTASRPRTWRMQLKKLVADNDEMSARLGNYLKPPAQSPDSRRWKRQNAKWKKHDEVRRKKQEKHHADWKQYLNDNLDEARIALQENPGRVTNSLSYLFDQARDDSHKGGRWNEYNWQELIPKYGNEIAHFYRDGTVAFWRRHEPKLRSEGAPPNQTTYAVLIGLTGLEIEAIETKSWPNSLSSAEVELACKYAVYELNGFPPWFPKLFEAYPNIVGDFLLQEIKYELAKENTELDTHYVLSDLSSSGQWAWDQLAPSVLNLLKNEPKKFSNLSRLLIILQGSDLSDEQIEALAHRKCRTLKRPDHLARWFAVWIGVTPDKAITALETRVSKITMPEEQTSFAVTFATCLLGSRSGYGVGVRAAFQMPKHLTSLYLLMHKYIRQEEDIERAGTGVYSPGLRDNAQDARNDLFNLLNQIPGKESFLALLDIAKLHPEETSRPWMLLHAKTKAEKDGDSDPWSAEQVRDFNQQLDRTPGNHRELSELAAMRLLDLKDDLEHGDSSIADILKTVTQETDIRKYLGRELRDKALGRYSIPQEEELADAKRPDLRFHGVGFDGPVPIELKLADNWTGPKLFERLENQLCGDYLRGNHSSRGVFALVYRGDKQGWDIPNNDNRVDFDGLTTALQDHWASISPKFPNVDDIRVIGVDLTKRSDLPHPQL